MLDVMQKKCNFHIRIRLGKYKSFDAYTNLYKRNRRLQNKNNEIKIGFII